MGELRLEILVAALTVAQIGSAALLWRMFRGAAGTRRALALERAERQEYDQALCSQREDLEARILRLESLAGRIRADRRLTAARRAEALSQLRRGVAPETVSRTMRLAAPEVALLLAIDRMRRGAPAAEVPGRARRQAA